MSNYLVQLTSVLVLATALAACARDEETPPDTGPIIRRDAGSADSGVHPDAQVQPDAEVADTGLHPDADVVADSGTDAGTAPDAEVADSGEHPDAADSCGGDGGCWGCAPATPEQVLNQCGPGFGGCTPFDNVARLPLISPDGGVPALP